MILIVASPKDLHARRVAQEIERLGARATIFDWRTAGSGAVASIRFQDANISRWIHSAASDEAIDFDEVRAVWTRRVGAAVLSPSIVGLDQRNFVAAEWRDLLYGLVDGVGAVSPLPAQRAAIKPRQLSLAGQIGLRIPDTLITSDPAAAADFIEAHDGNVVHKAMNSPTDRLLATIRWDERQRSELDRLTLAPTIFQELVSGPRDIRLTVIGPALYAASIENDPSSATVDSRLNMDVPVSEFELPAMIRSQLVDLMRGLGLSFATIDLKQDWDGELHFLELNPQGQFLYIEILTGMPLAAALAEYLVRIDFSAGTDSMP
jgi:hypothetical protein